MDKAQVDVSVSCEDNDQQGKTVRYQYWTQEGRTLLCPLVIQS